MMFVLWKMFSQLHYWPLWWTVFRTNTSFTAAQNEVVYIHDAPALTNILNSHFTGFLGLYSHVPLRLVLAGMICSSTVITSSGSTFKQFACTTLSNSRRLNSSSYLFSSFNELSTRWIEPRKFLYLFLENVSVIKLRLNSETNIYLEYAGRKKMPIIIWISKYCSISETLVLTDFPFFITLHWLDCSTISSVISSDQNCEKILQGDKLLKSSGDKLKASPTYWLVSVGS